LSGLEDQPRNLKLCHEKFSKGLRRLKMAKKKDFKSRASSIFKDVMGDRASDTQLHEDVITHNRSTTDAQLQTAGHAQKEKISKVVRLHVFIGYDLEKKLLDEVFKRKKNPNVSQNRSNKRAIIEEALRGYFRKK